MADAAGPPLSQLNWNAPLAAYDQQAGDLLSGWRKGEAWALDLLYHRHPRFLDDRVPWLPKRLTHADIRASALTKDDARLALARWYDFRDWTAVETYMAAVADPAAARFEAAVDSMVSGDLAGLQTALAADPALVHARSARVTHFDPPVHRATLLHYVAANGVEGHRQRAPVNAPEIARALLEAGAEADGLADMYGGTCTTMSLLVSSDPPARAGVQLPLIETLADFGASVEAHGEGSWSSPLMTALTFGFRDAAAALVRRGARVDAAAKAAGLDRLPDLERLLPAAMPDDRHRALAIAAQLGHAAIVERLLDAGEDPNRYNPTGAHAHATPLHHAALGGHLEVVRLLVARGARTDIEDTIYRSTPLGWALHAGHEAVAAFLRARL